jgi:hypothetical protein
VLNTVHRRKKTKKIPLLNRALSGCPGSRIRTLGSGSRSLLTDRQQQTIKERRWAQLPTLGRTFRLDQWENTAAEEKILSLSNFFQGYMTEEKNLSLFIEMGKSILFLVFT